MPRYFDRLTTTPRVVWSAYRYWRVREYSPSTARRLCMAAFEETSWLRDPARKWVRKNTNQIEEVLSFATIRPATPILCTYSDITDWVHIDNCCSQPESETDFMGLHHGRNI